MLDLENEETLNPFIKRYQKKIYALVYYLIGNNKDRAYEITAISFVEAFLSTRDLDNEDSLTENLVQIAIEKCRASKTIPTKDNPQFVNIPPEKVKILHIVKEVLQALPFEEKTLLLLRDQIHLSYKNIAAILGVSQSDARSQINKARIQIRKKVEGALL